MFQKLFFLVLLALLLYTSVQKKNKSTTTRKRQIKDTRRKQQQMRDALKKINPEEIDGWSVETVVAQLDNNKNIECRVIHGLSKGQDGQSLEAENTVICQQQGLDKNTWYVRMVQFKEKQIFKKKGKKNVEEDYRFFQVFEAARTQGLQFKPAKEEKSESKKEKKIKK